MKPHPIALLLPAMTDDAYAELRSSIRVNGLREPITVHRDGRIIDGRHRERVCRELGIPVRRRTFDRPDSEILAFVLDLNVKRRHLDESQRAMVAAKLATLGEGRPGKTAQICAVSQGRAAGLLNVSRRSVQHAAEVRGHAIPEIIVAVERGALPVSKAVLAARLSEVRQQQVVRELGNGKSTATTVLAASRSERVEIIERASIAAPLSLLGRRFPVLYADPPWHFQAWSEGGQQKAAEMHYPTMSIEALCALPVADIAARDSVLFMWALPALFPEALRVVDAWGFTFKTFAVWLKDRQACGHWFRGKHEPLIVATKGDMPPPPELRESVFEGSTSGRHSEKPAVVRDWIASAYPEAGKIELFARDAAPGWAAWGHEVG